MKTLLTAWSFLILAFVLASLDAQAESLGEEADGFRLYPARIYPNAWEGFLVDLPAPPPTVSLEEVRLLRRHMSERRELLDNRMDASKLTVPEVLVGIVVPGGTAFLIGKAARHRQAQQAFEGVTADLRLLGKDLLAFQELARTYVTALARGR